MVLFAIMRNYFNFSGIMTQLVSSSKNLSLVLVFSRLLGVISFTSTILGPDGRGGASILLRHSVRGSEIPLRSPLHTVVIRIHLRSLLPVSGFSGELIGRDDLFSLLRQLPEPILLVGDFNILHPSWGDTVA